MFLQALEITSEKIVAELWDMTRFLLPLCPSMAFDVANNNIGGHIEKSTNWQ
jgi:hypothetical protein